MKRWTSQVPPSTPIVLPATSPATIPSVIGSASAAPMPPESTMDTPAAKKAKTGTAKPAEIGRNRCSKYSARPGPGPSARRITGTANPSSTPATVACTPDACISAQVTAASGSSNHQERIRRWTRTVNTANGISISASGTQDSSSV